MRNVPSLEAIHQDFAPKGVQFYYIYKSLAHPETNGYVAPVSLEERLMHVAEAQRTLGTKIPWLCDTMENDVKHGLGDAPNSEFILDAQGRVLVKRSWSNPDELRSDLEKLVGKVDRPTTIASLNLPTKKPNPEASTIASGVLPKLKLPEQMRPLVVETVRAGGEPFYVKLRAEAEPALLRDGEGRLYLVFHLDPLYHVHWNNLAAPLKFEIQTSSSATLARSAGEAPKVNVEADSDPREFLLEVTLMDRSKPLELTVQYFACHDEEGWCKPITQTYRIKWQADQDGGSVRRGNRPRGTAQNNRRPEMGNGPGRNERRRPDQRPGMNDSLGTANRPIAGRVVSIDAEAQTITVRLAGGSEVEYNAASARLMDADGLLDLEQLKENDRVMLGVTNDQDADGRVVLRRLMRR